MLFANVYSWKDYRYHVKLKNNHYRLPVLFHHKNQTNTVLFWGNWFKKFREKFSKIVIVSGFGRKTRSKRNVIRIIWHLMCFKNTVKRGRFRVTKINLLIYTFIKKFFVLHFPQKTMQLSFSNYCGIFFQFFKPFNIVDYFYNFSVV